MEGAVKVDESEQLPETAFPPPGSSDPEDYAAISQKFVAHARDELRRGNRLQASEKVWGAANYALKAVALQRGWRHGGQRNVFAIAQQLAEEANRPYLADQLMAARGIHYNFYDNDLDETDISRGIDAVGRYVAVLDEVRVSPPQPFTIRTEQDQNRLQRLVGRTFAIGTCSEDGFVQPTQPRNRGRRRRGAEGDTGPTPDD